MARQPGNTVDFWTLATAFTLSTTLGFAEEIQIVDVPAQPLPAAIAELSEETDVEVMAAAEALSGQVSSQVKGPMSLQKALDTMLIGTGLAASTIAEDSYVVSRNFVSQNSIEEEPFDLGTLVVSGELIERNVQESQTSAVVISGEELERRSDPGLINTLERTPGVTIAGAARVPSVRGVNQRGPSANGAATISLTVDGAAISDFGLLVENGPFSVWDLEQVEILRGPQSTQSGRNALAGAINIRSRDPFMGEEYKVRLEAGSRATTGLSFAYNTFNAAETIALRFSADLRATDGFVENSITGADDVGQERNNTYRAGLLWQPNDRFSTIVKYSYSDLKTGLQLIDTARFPGDRFNDSNFDTFQKSEIGILNLRANYEFTPSLKLQFETTFLDADYEQPIDSDLTAGNFGSITRFRDFKSQQYELKLLYEEERVKGILGLLYAKSEEDGLTDGTFPFGPGFANLTSIDAFDAENTAVFGEIEYDLGRGFTIIGGLRYDREDQDDFTDRTITGAPFPPEAPTFSSTSFDAFLPKLGIVYDFDEFRSLGFTVQRGYRAGGAVNVPALGVVPFDPEFTTNYELAYRSQSPDGVWLFNANAFFTQWEDQQVSVGTNLTNFRTVNAGESEYYGLELEAQWRPTSNWDLFASAAYLQTEFIEFNDGGTDLSGNEFRDAPDFTLSVGGTYSFDSGAYVSSDVNYTASSFADAANTIENDDRLLANLRVGYRQDNWEVFAFARNLFDEEYTFGSTSSPFGNFAFVGEPRTIGVVFQATF